MSTAVDDPHPTPGPARTAPSGPADDQPVTTSPATASPATASPAVTDTPLAGLTVVVTGDVPGLDRTAAKAAVVALGGTAAGTVGARTHLLVAGAGAGHSKMAKATQHGIPVMDADTFAALAADPSTWTGLPATATTTEGATEDAAVAEAVTVSDHPVTQAVVYPGGARQIRMACGCGHTWPGRSVGDVRRGCPLDPEGYPRPSWSPAAFTTGM